LRNIHVNKPCDSKLVQRDELGISLTDITSYKSRVMKMMYLAKATRPDLLFCCSTLASYSNDPHDIDHESVNKMYKYLASNLDLSHRIKVNGMKLTASIDASYDLHRDHRGHNGLVVSIGGSPVYFRSIKQKSIATSSAYAETIAMDANIDYVLCIFSRIIE